jgi:hypothetical protein
MDLKSKVKKYIYFYNHNRFHSALDYKKPMNVYLEGVKKLLRIMARGWKINSQKVVLTNSGTLLSR